MIADKCGSLTSSPVQGFSDSAVSPKWSYRLLTSGKNRGMWKVPDCVRGVGFFVLLLFFFFFFFTDQDFVPKSQRILG